MSESNELSALTALVPRPTDELVQRATELSGAALGMKVPDEDAYYSAAVLLQKLKGYATTIDEERKAHTRPLDARKQSIMAAYSGITKLVERAESTLKREIQAFVQRQRDAAREAQAALDREAEERRQKLEQQAQRAEEKGKFESAEKKRTQADYIVAPTTQPSIPKVRGVSTTQVWKFAIDDESLVPREYLSVDEKKIGAVVRALGGMTNIPGVRVWEEDQIKSRSQ